MRRARKPDPDKADLGEADLFRRAVGEVTPLRQGRVPPISSKPQPVATQRLADEAAVVKEMAAGFFDTEAMETGDELLYQRPGIQDKVFRKLRRGQFAIAQELDLHGYTVQHAKDCLSDFLKQCLLRNHRCVRIIHGKGLRSKQGRPTIKSLIGKWLQQRREVLAYCSARQVDGGTGAIYVLLKNYRG
ncbi:MAG: Smr/MutS family protein [Gammaproteobacteria bacterium]|nr:Smr/MutS family protein [Gammaproteobacteria bacterium]MCY4337646.1 Smr/MutS family protein [Gammaproteobacteria bacterium]